MVEHTYRKREKRRRLPDDAGRLEQSYQRPETHCSTLQAPGNQQLQRFLAKRAVQPKLTISSPDDAYEREAERVTEAVMRMSEPAAVDNASASEVEDGRVQRMCSRCRHRQREGKPLNCRDCEENLQRRESSAETPEVTGGLEQQIASVRRAGSPLPSSVRSYFEPRFGSDFSDVRVHTGSRADRAARSVNAEAFTVGRDVAFRSGAYQPETASGRRLIAHELTHVLQQRRNSTIVQRQTESGGDGGTAPEEWPEVRFEHNSTSFTAWNGVDPEEQLAEMVRFARRFLQARPEGRIILFGYASEEGDAAYNQTLSMRRAERVREYLVARGIPEDRVITRARGEDMTYPGLEANRRVKLRSSPIILKEISITGMTPEGEELRRCGVQVISVLSHWHAMNGGTGDILFQAAEERAASTAGGAAYFEVDPKWGPGVQVMEDICSAYPGLGMCQQRAEEQSQREQRYQEVYTREFWEEYKHAVLQQRGDPDEGCFHLIFQETDLFEQETQDHPVLRSVEQSVADAYEDYQIRKALASYLVELANQDQAPSFFYVPPRMSYSEAKEVVDRLVGRSTSFAEGRRLVDEWYRENRESLE